MNLTIMFNYPLLTPKNIDYIYRIVTVQKAGKIKHQIYYGASE